MKEIDKLAWVCIKEKQLLVARSKGKETYYIPGGKREPGETDQAAVIREIKEELSVDLKPSTIKYLGTFTSQADEKPEGMIVKITCYSADFLGEIQASAEIEEVKWFAYQEKEQCSSVTKLILEWLKSEGMIE
jgi:8-oxo-dGTP diphosphatase